MPVKYKLLLRNVQNVAAGATVLIELPLGRRYHYIGIMHGFSVGTNTVAAAAANITGLRVKVNGRVQRNYALVNGVSGGQMLIDKNILNGAAYAPTGLPNAAPGVCFGIYFAEPWLTDELSQDSLAWPTDSFSSFQVEIDLGAASTPTIQAFAVVDDLQTGKVPLISKHVLLSAPAGGTSFDFTTLDRKDNLRVLTVYPDGGASNQPTPVIARANGQVIHELNIAQNNGLLNNFFMTPTGTNRTTKLYDLVFDHDGLLQSSVPMAGLSDFVLTVQAAAAMSGTCALMVERLGPPD
jgi:hypothetical protein